MVEAVAQAGFASRILPHAPAARKHCPNAATSMHSANSLLSQAISTMRPITLEITGLNSFRQKQVIKFDRLLADGLFGIFGPTGSGKSSILDAITLALYGYIHRASHGVHGVINEQETNAAVSFTFEIGHGAERQRYTAERHLVQKKEKKEAAQKKEDAQVRKIRLIHHTPDGDVPLADKKKEMDKAIQNIIGISLQDFQHAVMLPQGKFASFLALTPGERGKTLQRLFGLQQYGDQLEAKVKRLEQELRLEHAEAEGSLKMLEQYNDQALEACHNQTQAAAEALTAAEATLRQATESAQAARALLSLIEELSDLDQAIASVPSQEELLQSHKAKQQRAQQAEATRQAIDSAAAARQRHTEAEGNYQEIIKQLKAHEPTLTQVRERFERAEKAFKPQEERKQVIETLRLLRQQKEKLKHDIKKLRSCETDLAEANNQHQAAANAREAAETKTRDAEANYTQAKLKLKHLELDAQQRERMRTLADRLKERNNAATELDKQQTELATAQQQHAELQQEQQRISHNIQPLQSGIDNAKQLLEQQRNHQAKLATTLEELRTAHGHLSTASKVIATYRIDHLQKQQEEEGPALNRLRQQLETENEATAQAETSYQTARRQREELERKLGLATAVAHLHDGQPCPLCGATEHPAPYHPEDGEQKQAAALRNREQQCETALKQATERQQKTTQQLATAESEVRRIQQGISTAENSIATELQHLHNRLMELQRPMVIATASELQKAIEDVTGEGTAIRHQQEAAQKEGKEVEEQISKNQQRLGQAQNELARIEERVASLAQSCQKLSDAIAQQQSQVAEAERKLVEHSGGKSLEEIQTELRELANREQQIDEINKLCTTLEAQVNTAREEEKQARAAEQDSQNKQTAAKTAHDQLNAETEASRISIAERLNEVAPNRAEGEAVEHILSNREAEAERIESEHTGATLAYNDAQTTQRHLKKSADEAYNKLCSQEQQRDAATADCRAVIAREGFASQEEATAALLPPGDIAQLAQAITTIERKISDVRKREAELREQVANKTVAPEEVEHLEQAKRSAETVMREAISSKGVAESTLQVCQEQNQKWKQLQAANSDAAKRIATIRQLAKYLHGSKFVNYLANERMDDVCRRASQLLSRSTQHRFQVRSDHESGFYIIDNRNGGVQREAGTLSGGETFLVSLSLALALSDTIQLGHAPLEFFFLDEGFGTLDNELLDTVMNELERLRSPNRAIGLISHVRELRERIPRKLIVHPATTENGTTVGYE